LNYKIVTKEELEGRRSSGVLGSGFIPKTLFLSKSPQDSHRQLQIVPDKELGSILDYIRAHRSSCADEFIMKEGENCFTFGDEMILVAVEYCRLIQQMMWMAQSNLWLTLLAIVFGFLERGAILLSVCDLLDITSNFPFAVP
jgi:hypothetical protein